MRLSLCVYLFFLFSRLPRGRGANVARSSATAPRSTGPPVPRATAPTAPGSPSSRLRHPLPDFTDCSFATRSPTPTGRDRARGGPVRAFDRRMPAFGEALTEERDQRRRVHPQPSAPTALAARRAEPAARARHREGLPGKRGGRSRRRSAGGDAGIGRATSPLREAARRAQPVRSGSAVRRAQDGEPAAWQRGLGDVAVAFKHVLFHSLDAGTIVSAAARSCCRPARRRSGLGKGVTVFEPFVAVGSGPAGEQFPARCRPAPSCRPTRRHRRHEAFWRAAVGARSSRAVSAAPGRRWSRCWAPASSRAGERASGTSCRRCR